GAVELEHHTQQAGADLVLPAGVGAGFEVTRGARLHAVAADLHVPEQRLAESPGRLLVADEVAEIGRSRNGNAGERCHLPRRFAGAEDRTEPATDDERA